MNYIRAAFLIFVAATLSTALHAQAVPVGTGAGYGLEEGGVPRGEAGFNYNYIHANAPPGQCGCFSLNGGSASFVYNIKPSWAAVADLQVAFSNNVNNTGQNIIIINYLFGGALQLPQSHPLRPLRPVPARRRQGGRQLPVHHQPQLLRCARRRWRHHSPQKSHRPQHHRSRLRLHPDSQRHQRPPERYPRRHRFHLPLLTAASSRRFKPPRVRSSRNLCSPSVFASALLFWLPSRIPSPRSAPAMRSLQLLLLLVLPIAAPAQTRPRTRPPAPSLARSDRLLRSRLSIRHEDPFHPGYTRRRPHRRRRHRAPPVRARPPRHPHPRLQRLPRSRPPPARPLPHLRPAPPQRQRSRPPRQRPPAPPEPPSSPTASPAEPSSKPAPPRPPPSVPPSPSPPRPSPPAPPPSPSPTPAPSPSATASLSPAPALPTGSTTSS